MNWGPIKYEIPMTFCHNFENGETNPVKTFLLPNIGKNAVKIL